MAVAHAWPYSSHVWVQVYWNNQDCWPVQQKQWISILAEFWSFFNVDNSTNLRHMWSGPPMSPSPMSLSGRVGQILGLSSSKPNRFLDLFFVSTFSGWSWCHSAPWTVHRCRERLWRPSLLAAQVSQVFFGFKNPSPPREGEGKLRTSDPKFLARVRSWYVKLFSRWTYFFAYKYHMSTSSRLQGLFFHQGGPIIMVQVGWDKFIDSETT